MQLTSTVNRVGIRPVVITPLNNKQLYNVNGMLAGWGNTNRGPQDELFKAKVKILNERECTRKLKLITNNQLLGFFLGVGRNYLCNSADPYVLATCVRNRM